MTKMDGAKVFSATQPLERNALGDKVTKWLEEKGAGIEIVDVKIMQSSDSAYHCLSIVVLYANAKKS